MPEITWLVVLVAFVAMLTSSAVTSLREGVMTSGGKEGCEQTSPCSCRSSQGTLDLSPLADKCQVGFRFKDVLDTKGVAMYSWNPCLAFTEADCVGVAACQLYGEANASSWAIGTQGSARFVGTEKGVMTLQYTYPDPSGVDRTTIVTLVCKPNSENVLTADGEMKAFQYSLTLTSPFSCFRR